MTKDIEKLLSERKAAFMERDATKILASSAPDLIAYTLAPPLQTQSDENGFKSWLGTWKGPIVYEMQNLKIEAGAAVAFSTSLSRMRGEKTSGEKIDLWFREMLGFRKIDDAWTIVHEHTSVPFYMDGSMKAAVDLKP